MTVFPTLVQYASVSPKVFFGTERALVKRCVKRSGGQLLSRVGRDLVVTVVLCVDIR